MACDICGKTGTHLAPLRDAYKTAEIQQVCGACEKVLNAKLWKIRAVTDGMTRTLLKRFMGERRIATHPTQQPSPDVRKETKP